MNEIRTVAVTGATGFVGRYVVRALLAHGYHVRALVRDGHKAAAVLPPDKHVTLVAGEALDGKSPQSLVQGAQACINLIGIIREARGGQTFARMHVQTPRALVEACRESGVRRFVHMSALGVRPDGPAEYARTKAEGESVVRRSGLEWTVFRPGLIHGPDGELVKMIADWTRGKAAPYLFIPYFSRRTEHEEGVALGRVTFDPPRVAPVHVGDVASAFADCLETPESVHEVYNLVGGEELDWRQMLEFYKHVLPGADASLPVVGLWGEGQAKIAGVAKALGMGALLPFDAGQARMAQEDSTADTGKLREHLRISPRPFRASAAEYASAVV